MPKYVVTISNSSVLPKGWWSHPVRPWLQTCSLQQITRNFRAQNWCLSGRHLKHWTCVTEFVQRQVLINNLRHAHPGCREIHNFHEFLTLWHTLSVQEQSPDPPLQQHWSLQRWRFPDLLASATWHPTLKTAFSNITLNPSTWLGIDRFLRCYSSMSVTLVF